MAQSVVLVRPTNGVSYGTKVTITSAMVTAGGIILDFRKNGTGIYRFDIVAAVTVLSSVGAPVTISDLAITYPAATGQVSIAGTFTAGQVLNVIVQATRGTETLSA